MFRVTGITYFFLLVVLFLFESKGQINLLDSTSLANQFEYKKLETAVQKKDSVVKLVLRKQKLKEFPSEIFEFKNLQYLDLSKNRIQYLPDSLFKLENLQVLIVSKTGLKSFPKNIHLLKNLKYLNFNQNDIEEIPEEFSLLEKLEYADFWDNNLGVFPSNLYLLKNLKWMDFRNIMISNDNQAAINKQLPNTIIHFSKACNCGL
ncbi:MAG: leucine-rich repeat domain-containing protein [Bacteroidia bacterium]